MSFLSRALTLCALVLLAGCAKTPPVTITPPVRESAGTVRFVAWYSLGQLEVPLQGVLRLTADETHGFRAERMGVVLTHGPTVGISLWDEQGSHRDPSDMPGADRLLQGVEQAVVELVLQRGIAIPGRTGMGKNPPDCTVERWQDALPVELMCIFPSGEHVTVHLTGDAP